MKNHTYVGRVLLVALLIFAQGGFAQAATTCVTITHTLSRGSSGAEVAALQQTLAQDSSIYPEGLVTGNFGFFTQAAVQVAPPACPIYNACPTGYTSNTSTDANGCAIVQCVAPSTAIITLAATPIFGSAPLTVSFSANIKSTSSPCGQYPGYTIDFGDGNTAAAGYTLDSCNGPQWSHSYVSAGTYTAKLLGSSSQTISTATISVAANPATTFSATPTSGPAPLSVQFTITGGKGNYRLDFGDGQVVGPAICMEGSSCPSSYTISHTYSSTATYKATLTKSRDNSLVGSVTVSVTG